MYKLLTKIKSILKHEGFKKYASVTAWKSLVNSFTIFVNFIVSIYLARILGPENYGLLSFVISFFAIAGIDIFIINKLLIKKINEKEYALEEIMGSAFLIKFISHFSSIIIVLLIAILFGIEKYTLFLLLIFSIISLFKPFEVIRTYFNAESNVSSISKLDFVIKTISSVIRILFVVIGTGIIGVLLSYIIQWMLNAFIEIHLYRKIVGPIKKWKINKKITEYFIKNSWPFTISTLSAAIYLRIDQIFIKLFLGSDSVGIYVVAVKFSETFLFIGTMISLSLLPAILNSYKENLTKYKDRMKKLFSFLFYSSLFISIILIIINPIIIEKLYGTDYLESISVFKIYIWTIVGYYIFEGLQQFLLAENKFKTILYINTSMMIVAVVSNFILIKKMGIIGGAYSNIIIYFIPLLILLTNKNLKELRGCFIKGIIKPFKS